MVIFKNNQMKQFNLDEAKAGKSVCTRDGRKVQICNDLSGKYPYELMCKIGDRYVAYTLKGEFINGEQTNHDLMMCDDLDIFNVIFDDDSNSSTEKRKKSFEERISETWDNIIKRLEETNKNKSVELYPFDLEKAKTKSVEVRTRNGCKVNIITSEVKGKYPIVAIVKLPDNTEQVLTYTIDGLNSMPNPDFDLVLVKTKRVGWIVRDQNKPEDLLVYATLFQKKEDAEGVLKKANNPDLYITEVTYFL